MPGNAGHCRIWGLRGGSSHSIDACHWSLWLPAAELTPGTNARAQLPAASMVDYLRQHPLGAFHLLCGLAAIIIGAVVILARKGTRSHRWLGRAYLLSMVSLNLSALMIYRLFGQFGPFHVLALISLSTIVAGFISVRGRLPGWRQRHAYLMVGSYVGLLAAAVAEVATRVPGWQFGPTVVLSSVAVIGIGLILMFRYLPPRIHG